jgi:MFS family permease
MIGRKRAFMLGLVIYCSGSLTTALSPNLGVLIFGWSILEGIGAALIMPAIVALVAGNFPQGGRPRAYGLIGAAGAMAIAVGPLIGGLATTYASWRWVFAGEVIVGAGIVLLGRRMADTPVEERPHLDLLGSLLWALGMGLVVFGVLFSSEWGAIRPKEDGPSILSLSPVVWLILAGLIVAMVAIITLYPDPATEAAQVAWTEALHEKLATNDVGVYSNFLEVEGEERIREAYPFGTYERLADVKRRYDPANLFRLNQNIRPAAHG